MNRTIDSKTVTCGPYNLIGIPRTSHLHPRAPKSCKSQANVCNLPRRGGSRRQEQTEWPMQKGVADTAASEGGGGTNQRRIKYHSIYPSNICAFTVKRRIRGPSSTTTLLLGYPLYPLVPLCIRQAVATATAAAAAAAVATAAAAATIMTVAAVTRTTAVPL
ncbi:hypothetical protein HZH66_003452 [Vespula vulgaris]|uniref:Uncharacterized protein n=1 Tax=Vespula vulgaris TaxID=7454 RepID=A0A834KF06_VESVU|nr:hypothetical protein HZH66_003452 [Vespula vulgaris]